MKILICGDRNWEYQYPVLRVIDSYADWYGESLTIIEGGAKGVDRIAGFWCYHSKIPFIEIRAKWDKYGKAAGPIRNREMLDLKPDIVLAFHNDIENSRGTKNCCAEATKRGIPVDIFSYKI